MDFILIWKSDSERKMEGLRLGVGERRERKNKTYRQTPLNCRAMSIGKRVTVNATMLEKS